MAISIPIFTGQLKKAKIATDQANVRSAKAAAAAEYMTDGETGNVSYIYDGRKIIPVNSSNVTQVSSITSATGYGKSDAVDNNKNQTGASGTPKNAFVEVTINNAQSEQITARWVAGAAVFNSSSGDLLLTGNAISNGSIMSQINALGVEPSTIKTITASDGSKIDNNTEKVFADLTNLQKIDLSRATLEHSSFDMYADMPASVQEIVLPQCSSDYNILGTWYDKNGKQLPEGLYPPKGHNKNEYSRISRDRLPAKSTIYRTPEAAKAASNTGS